MRKGCNKKDIKTNMKTKISLYKTQIDNTLLPLESIFFIPLFISLYITYIIFLYRGLLKTLYNFSKIFQISLDNNTKICYINVKSRLCKIIYKEITMDTITQILENQVAIMEYLRLIGSDLKCPGYNITLDQKIKETKEMLEIKNSK